MEDDYKKNMGAEEHEGPIGPIVGSVIIIVVIIIGGLYFWGKAINDDIKTEMTAEEIRAQEDQQTAELQTQSNSDELDTIEEDINNSDFNDLDKEFDQIDNEIEG